MVDWVNSTSESDMSDISVEVAPVDLAPGELGLIAARKLEPGDILTWAPTSLLLTKEKAVEILGEAVEVVDDRIAISLLLIHERFVKGQASAWATYCDSLPAFTGDVSGPSFLWSPEEWDWLEGSDGYSATAQMRNTVEEEFADLQETLLKEHPAIFPPEIFREEIYLWAAAVVASRAYGDDQEGSHLAIAPLVDFLNHRAGSLQLTRFSNGIVAYAHQHYEKGEQVWVSYGGKNNAQLLSQYGFVDTDNQDEAIFLRMGPHFELAEPFVDEKRSLLTQLLGEDRDPDTAILRLPRRPREWEAELIPTIRTLALSQEDFVPVSIRELVSPQAPRLEAAAWTVLAEALTRRAAEYPTSLAEARAELAKGGLAERHALGLRLRISEQELIEEALVQAEERREAALADIE